MLRIHVNARLGTVAAIGLLAFFSGQRVASATTSNPGTEMKKATPMDRAAFDKDEADWRAARSERLRRPNGWLSLVGLHWVDPGVHHVGSAASNDIQLRTGPATLGTLTFKDGKAMFDPDAKAGVTIDNKPATGDIALRSDATTDAAGPTIVSFNKGSANFQVIERSGRIALRVKDANAATRTGFVGIDYFPADPAWRFDAHFEPHPPGRTIQIASVINTIEAMPNPGAVVFTKDGKTYRLEAVDEGDGVLSLIYADRTSGKTTYAAGRFLDAEMPKDGMTVVDFNHSYNPPCVFTHYATCPLPPPENRLDLAVTAGEKMYRGAAHHDAAEAAPARKGS